MGMRPPGDTSATFACDSSAASQIAARRRSPVKLGHGNRGDSSNVFTRNRTRSRAPKRVTELWLRPVRIVLLTPRLPWPPTDGGRIAMSRLAMSLANCGAEVSILSLNPKKHHVECGGLPPHSAIDIDTRFALPRRGVPYVVARFISREFAEAVRRCEADIVQIESPFMLPYAKHVRNAKVVLRSHNVEFRIWEGLARNEPNFLKRIALRRIASSLRRYELREMNDVDAIVPISEDDARDFRELGCTTPMHIVPCGVVLPDRGEPVKNSVGFIGSLDYRPNQEAVKWILDVLWPRVLRRAPEARLSIAGSSPPEWLRAHA